MKTEGTEDRIWAYDGHCGTVSDSDRDDRFCSEVSDTIFSCILWWLYPVWVGDRIDHHQLRRESGGKTKLEYHYDAAACGRRFAVSVCGNAAGISVAAEKTE